MATDANGAGPKDPAGADPFQSSWSPSAYVVVVAVILAATFAALVWLQLTLGGVPVLSALLPDRSVDLVLAAGEAPLLDCEQVPATGWVVPAGGTTQVWQDLSTAAQAARLASSESDLLVGATAYEGSGDTVTVVWFNGSGKARLILSFLPGSSGYALTARSACSA